jgi:hypothetical protein
MVVTMVLAWPALWLDATTSSCGEKGSGPGQANPGRVLAMFTVAVESTTGPPP